MNAQDIIDSCDELFNREEFISELRDAEFLAENLNNQKEVEKSHLKK